MTRKADTLGALFLACVPVNLWLSLPLRPPALMRGVGDWFQRLFWGAGHRSFTHGAGSSSQRPWVDVRSWARFVTGSFSDGSFRGDGLNHPGCLGIYQFLGHS
jgi:hypothetical protein